MLSCQKPIEDNKYNLYIDNEFLRAIDSEKDEPQYKDDLFCIYNKDYNIYWCWEQNRITLEEIEG